MAHKKAHSAFKKSGFKTRSHPFGKASAAHTKKNAPKRGGIRR